MCCHKGGSWKREVVPDHKVPSYNSLHFRVLNRLTSLTLSTLESFTPRALVYAWGGLYSPSQDVPDVYQSTVQISLALPSRCQVFSCLCFRYLHCGHHVDQRRLVKYNLHMYGPRLFHHSFQIRQMVIRRMHYFLFSTGMYAVIWYILTHHNLLACVRGS